MNRLRAAIVGGSGYTGGVLLRLLHFHPMIELTQVASSSHAGQYIHSVHPNLRKQSSLRFCHPDDLATALASLASVQQNEVGTAIDLRLRDRSGLYRTYEVRGRDVGPLAGVRVLSLDG